ncbi:glycine zipper 2TM domain-containing protein [Sphingomonas sp.]|uniref:glycine zipper 2TM domain-containing protein n=1 Tax=Sphingomonas sp. TaxID=28214 RepID=UPI002C59B958|nr:glycine zipper 2TM domain-containing protein [Sphingomonas sp.]HWK36102.1 glycine zipper 2TM domain-containing protein [Sphingomonas sp.]
MRNLMLAIGAAALVVPAATVVPVSLGTSYGKADAQQHKRYKYREWRGRDGRTYCRKADGTTGLIVGGVAGALLGRTVDTRGDRTLGTVLGAGAGALAGREIDRGGSKRRCR